MDELEKEEAKKKGEEEEEQDQEDEEDDDDRSPLAILESRRLRYGHVVVVVVVSHLTSPHPPHPPSTSVDLSAENNSSAPDPVLSFIRSQSDNARSGSMLGWDLDSDDFRLVDPVRQQSWVELYGADLKRFVAVHATDFEVHPLFQGISQDAARAWRSRTRDLNDLPETSTTHRNDETLQQLFTDPFDPLDVDEDVSQIMAVAHKEGEYEGEVAEEQELLEEEEEEEEGKLAVTQEDDEDDNDVDNDEDDDEDVDDEDEVQVNVAPLTERENRV